MMLNGDADYWFKRRDEHRGPYYETEERGCSKSVEYHQNFLRVCDQMLATLNPEFAAKQQQEQEISALKGQMSNMDKNMQEMSRNMADLIAQTRN